MSSTPTADAQTGGPFFVLLAGPPTVQPVAQTWRRGPEGTWTDDPLTSLALARLVAALELESGYRWDDPPSWDVLQELSIAPGKELGEAADNLIELLDTEDGLVCCRYDPGLFVLALLGRLSPLRTGLVFLTGSDELVALAMEQIGWTRATARAISERYLSTGLRILETVPGLVLPHPRADQEQLRAFIGRLAGDQARDLPQELLETLEEHSTPVTSPPYDAFEEGAPKEAGAGLRQSSSEESAVTNELLGFRHAARQLAVDRGPAHIAQVCATSAEAYPLDATQDLGAYHAWLARGGAPAVFSLNSAPQPKRQRAVSSPLFSVLLLGTDQTADALQLDSLRLQTNGLFECVLPSHRSATEFGKDRRFRAIDEDENLKPAGRFVLLVAPGYLLEPSALSTMAEALRSAGGVRLVYCDEDSVDAGGVRSRPIFKPGWSPEFLLRAQYLGGLVGLRAELYGEVWRENRLPQPIEVHGLLLEAAGQVGPDEVLALPQLLSHHQEDNASASPLPAGFGTSQAAARQALDRSSQPGEVRPHPSVPGAFTVLGKPRQHHLVSIIVPFRDEPALLAACYRSIVADPGEVDFELLLVDNGSLLPETEATLRELGRDRRVRYLEAPGRFNWSTINNDAASQALGDQLLFLNNDVEALSPGWLERLVATAERRQVGAVGARLVYPDGTLQHGGMTVGLGYGALHDQQGIPEGAPGYLGRLLIAHECSAVTGACLLSSRAVFEAVKGFDPELPTAFGDVDYCLRVRGEGLSVLYEPEAVLMHHESKSRGRSGEAEGVEIFRRRWREMLWSGDPYCYNPNLGRFDPYFRLPASDERAEWETVRHLLGAP